jgi:hypothetical protein
MMMMMMMTTTMTTMMIDDDDDNLQSLFARCVCVRASGFDSCSRHLGGGGGVRES